MLFLKSLSFFVSQEPLYILHSFLHEAAAQIKSVGLKGLNFGPFPKEKKIEKEEWLIFSLHH